MNKHTPDDGGARERFEDNFLNYFGRGPNGAPFDKLGQFWLDRLADGRYEITRVDDAWTGWLACERANAHRDVLLNVSRLGHQQMFEKAQELTAVRDDLLAALQDALSIFKFGEDDKTVVAPKWVARAEAAVLKATGEQA